MIKGKTNISLHISFWLLYWIILWFTVDINWYNPTWDFWRMHLLERVFDQLIAFYIYYFVLIRLFLFQKQYILFSIGFILVFGTNYFLQGMMWSHRGWDSFFSPLPKDYFGLFYGQSYFIMSGMAIAIFENWQSTYASKIELEKQVRDSELQFLNAQMNPHFLFNTLNNIYSLSLSNNTQTSLALLELNENLNYLEESSANKKLDLIYEVNHLKSYIELNKLRFPVAVTFKDNMSNKDLKISPMLLSPFIENAFKHGQTAQNNSITIHLTEKNNLLTFVVKNDVDLAKRKDEVSGIGIGNIKKRLKILYPNRHKLTIQSDLNLYSIHLTIQL